MRTIVILLALLLLIGPLPAAAPPDAPPPPDEDPLATLRTAHPRLMLLDEDLPRLKQLIETDDTAAAWFQELRSAADALLDQPASRRVLIGPRLLHVSRQVLGRVTTLAGIWRLSGDGRYADRARDELLAVAAFEDWNPSHFLDVAEMTCAVALGYDWLHANLSDDERATLRNAIIEKGLMPGLDVYARKNGWHVRSNNWNQVCNGGLTVGALAVAEHEPDLARQIIRNARASLPIAMKEFAPDGGIVEGPAYWAYATQYVAYLLAATETALGTDFGLLKTPGLAETGLFRIHSIGSIGRTFNFADAGDSVGAAPQMFYFARVFDRPVYAAHERLRTAARKGQVSPFHLFWFNPAGCEADIEKLPRAAAFGGIDVAFMRSAWLDRDAAFVGFKGGDNAASHAHLDLGSFVYDVAGVRWAFDLGGDDYNLPGYFGGNRWSYYRLRSEGQNTLTLDGENQSPRGRAPLVGFGGEPPFAVADLSEGYPMAQQVRRGIQLIGRRLLVQDEIRGEQPVEVTWHLHVPTKIEVAPDARRAVLSQDGKHLAARILSPKGARFEVAPSDPDPPVKPAQPQRPKVDRTREKLIIRLPEKVTNLRLVVLFDPAGESAGDVAIKPLQTWLDATPARK